MAKVFWFSLLVLVSGCASSSDEVVENPNVPAAAFAADGFTFYVEPPLHPEWKPVKFYFKNCEETGFGNHISKTAYSCTYP